MKEEKVSMWYLPTEPVVFKDYASIWNNYEETGEIINLTRSKEQKKRNEKTDKRTEIKKD